MTRSARRRQDSFIIISPTKQPLATLIDPRPEVTGRLNRGRTMEKKTSVRAPRCLLGEDAIPGERVAWRIGLSNVESVGRRRPPLLDADRCACAAAGQELRCSQTLLLVLRRKFPLWRCALVYER